MPNERIEGWAQQLVALGVEVVSLNDIGQVIGAAATTPDEIGQLLQRLQTLGLEAHAGPASAPRENLHAVLTAAREIKQAGELPTTQRIAALSGLSESEVKGSLLYAQVGIPSVSLTPAMRPVPRRDHALLQLGFGNLAKSAACGGYRRLRCTRTGRCEAPGGLSRACHG